MAAEMRAGGAHVHSTLMLTALLRRKRSGSCASQDWIADDWRGVIQRHAELAGRCLFLHPTADVEMRRIYEYMAVIAHDCSLGGTRSE